MHKFYHQTSDFDYRLATAMEAVQRNRPPMQRSNQLRALRYNEYLFLNLVRRIPVLAKQNLQLNVFNLKNSPHQFTYEHNNDALSRREKIVIDQKPYRRKAPLLLQAHLNKNRHNQILPSKRKLDRNSRKNKTHRQS